jgi:hypothetical protein
MTHSFDRYFFAPVAAVRPWLLSRIVPAIQIVDCFTLLPRSPVRRAPVSGGCCRSRRAGSTRARSARRRCSGPDGNLVDERAGQLPANYLTSLLLWLVALFPRLDRRDAASERVCAWAFRLLAVEVGVVYA